MVRKGGRVGINGQASAKASHHPGTRTPAVDAAHVKESPNVPGSPTIASIGPPDSISPQEIRLCTTSSVSVRRVVAQGSGMGGL